MRRLITTLVIAAALFTPSVPTWGAGSSLIQPGPILGKDAVVVGGILANNRYGSLNYLMTNPASGVPVAGLIEFPLDNISSHELVQSAALGLYHAGNNQSGNTIYIYRNTASWDESTVTYNTRPTYDAAPVGSLTIGDSLLNVFREWDVTGLVQGWLAGSYANHGLSVVPADIYSQRPYFMSSDAADAAQWPYLRVEVGGFPQPVFKNHDFENGLVDWIATPSGTVLFVESPGGSGNHVARLTASSQVGIEQETLIPAADYMLVYDYQFGSTAGTLDVYVGTTLVDTIAAPSIAMQGLQTRALLVEDPAAHVGGLAAVSFLYTGDSGTFVMLDSVSVPEPTLLHMLPLAVVAWLGRWAFRLKSAANKS